MKTVLLVDDHALFRSGLRRLLEGEGIARVVGEAGNGVEMLDMLAFEQPDLVFLDIDMPVMDGRQSAAAALARWPELRIIALSMHSDEHYYLAMVEAGVKGFLLKDSAIDEVAEAIEAVCAGGEYFSPCYPNTLQDDLSARELEVLLCVCAGLSNQEIADKLFISKRTVDKHRANIMLKTDSRNTANLVVYAIKRGLVEL